MPYTRAFTHDLSLFASVLTPSEWENFGYCVIVEKVSDVSEAYTASTFSVEQNYLF
jgi:hypothetical protein